LHPRLAWGYWRSKWFPFRFWDLLCSSCGNQSAKEKVKVFSVRRNINSWSDIAHLLISCLSVSSQLKLFDLETQMIPFLENNMDRLHLPRQARHTSETLTLTLSPGNMPKCPLFLEIQSREILVEILHILSIIPKIT
jgi:hypothetical protein